MEVINPNTTPFTESGECSDEIVFLFDDEKKLYVSQNFLNYVSPVFKAMFEHNFKEKDSQSVTMAGKTYEDVLEFLLCVHPNVQKAVNNDNVLSVAHIAEEYQAKLIITKCQHVMLKWLKSELSSAQKAKDFVTNYPVKQARACLSILTKAKHLQYLEVVEQACKVIGHFGHAIFTGTVHVFGGLCVQQDDDIVKGCRILFDNLPIELKYKLLQERLQRSDNLEMYVDSNEYHQTTVKSSIKPQRK